MYSAIKEGRGDKLGMPPGFLECSVFDDRRTEAEVLESPKLENLEKSADSFVASVKIRD